MPDMSSPLYRVEPGGEIVLAVHVQPSAARAGVAGRRGDALKVKVSAPPEGGKANEAVARLLASELGLSRRDVELVRGASSRAKRFRLRNLDRPAFERWLARHGEPPRP